MKKLFTLFLIAGFTLTISAQAPQRLSYQAVVRNSTGSLVINHAIGMKISILQGSSSGTAVYVETHTPTTNANGLVTIEIGGGSLVSGSFTTINWSGNTYYLKTETDPSGGTSYTIVGTSQLLSVPYALNSKISDGVADNSINSGKISDGTIVTADLADYTVSTAKLGSLAVSSDKMQNGAVISDKLANSAVTTDKLAANAVTIAKLPSGATADKYLRGDGTWAVPSGSGGGLALPFSGSATTSGTAFSITNTGIAISGKSTATTGDTQGISGESLSVNGSGIYGKSPKYGVFGEAVRTTGTATIYGVFGKTEDAKGYGVYGQGLNGGVYGVSSAETGSTYGIIGTTLSPNGTGVSGTSAYRGMYGNASGYKGRAVVGEATGTNSVGLFGLATNDNSTGVWGEGANQGVYGKSDLATGKGVFGQVSSATGYSGYFDGGKFYVSGNVGIGTTSPSKKLHVNGSARVKDTLYANVVETSKITTMPGLAHSVVGSYSTPYSLPTSWGELNSVTINVPAPGYVILFVSGEFFSEHDYNDLTRMFLGISKNSDGTGVKQIAHWQVSTSVATSYQSQNISSQAPLQVTSTGSQTFYLMGYRMGGDNTDVVYRRTCYLTALYIPVAYGTVE